MEQRTVDVEALNGDFGGTVVGPEAETWDQDRAAWNLTDIEAIFAPDTLKRLRGVKREYDPTA
jgi:hypothetical protein